MSALACVLLAFAAAQGPALPTTTDATGAPGSSFERGVEAYRRNDPQGALVLWQRTLDEDLAPLERARVYFDLGNAHWRAGHELQAIACYSAAVRLDPRRSDAWQNLELARAKAGLPPADDGNLAATLRRVLTGLHADEQRALLFGALVAWSLALLVEVRRGGAGGRALLVLASLLLGLSAVPFGYRMLGPRPADPMLVVSKSPIALRSEPLESLNPIGELASLEEVERLDSLPGWVRVARADGMRGWVREDGVFALDLGRERAD